LTQVDCTLGRYSFDAYENTNEATANPDVVAKLRSLLHQAIANQTRIRSFGVL
jgi:PPE-repeat protein